LELQGQYETLKGQRDDKLGKVHDFIKESMIQDFGNQILIDLDETAIPSFAIYRTFRVRKRELAILFHEVAVLSKRAHDQVHSAFPSRMNPPTTLAKLREAGILINTHLEEIVFALVTPRVFEDARAQFALPNNWNFNDYEIEKEMDGTRVVEAIQELDELNSVLTNIDFQLDLARKEVLALARPSGLVFGLVAFVTFAILGIFVPLFLMTRRPLIDNVSMRDITLVSFSAGFTLLVIYLALSVKNLTTKDRASK
jgi:hypothetical protein